MLSHISKLLWNTRRSGILLTLQIFIAFLVLFGIFSFAGERIANYVEPLGFDVGSSYVVNVDLPDGVDTAAWPELYQRTRAEVEALDGVKAASMISDIKPFSGNAWGYGTDIGSLHIYTRLFMCDERFAEAAEPELVAGRWFTPADTIGNRWGVVVNEMFVEENFPQSNLLDTTLAWFNDKNEGRQTTIVGIVKNFRYLGEFAAEQPLTFVPTSPFSDDWGLDVLYVRTAPGTPAEIEEQIFERVSEVTKSRDSVVEPLERRRARTSKAVWVPLVALLTICAFLVANVALGLFGILINAIAKRRGEIGLRKAMGATGLDITTQFTLEVVLIALLGIALGSLVAVQIPLFELIELETRYFWWGGVLAAALILIIVLGCALIPSSHAARVHAAVALREE